MRKNYKKRLNLIAFCFIFYSIVCFGQEEWFYLRAVDTTINPSFEKVDNYLIYNGNDAALKNIFSKYQLKIFKKTWKHANKINLKKTFFAIADNSEFGEDLVRNAPHLFEYFEKIEEEDKKIFEPNDYGLTSTIGENIGAQVNLDYYDVIGVPEAWYYTTGSRDIIIGISDGSIDSLDIEFKGKTKIVRPSTLSDGHGYYIAEIAAGQGNNGYGIPGVCYDCSIYATNYGHWSTLEQLVELSEMGVKVINCSWGTTKYYQTAQDAIHEMLKNGTVVVATEHNKPFPEGEGKIHYYPGSYDGVISVSSVSHRYEDYRENIKKQEGRDSYYVENIRNYLGRTAGFKDSDTTQSTYLYSQSIRNLNDKVDILAPAIGLFQYNELVLRDEIKVTEYNQTSGAVPLVSGTIGLMFSLYPCLPADEVESIIKLTATNIDYLEVNKPYYGLYGAGVIHTGRAVKMVHELFADDGLVKIENQIFKRWNFKLTSLSPVKIQNQEFSETSTLDLVSKEQVVISENTILKPSKNGAISVKINPLLKKGCELRLRE